ncbi:MAG: esterase-like activity of phytase family protein [Phycisphaerae bacterium]
MVWHPRLASLLVVSDEGELTRLDTDGRIVKSWTIKADLEAVCVANPSTDLVYLGVEKPDSVVEFNLATGRPVRVFDLRPWMKGPPNEGLEALTFVPDDKNPQGGLFYAGLEFDGSIHVFELPIVTGRDTNAVIHKNTIKPAPERLDLSALDFHRPSRTLYAAYGTAGVLRAMKPDGTLIQEWNAPGRDQEGIALADDQIFIAQDGQNGVWKFPFRPPSS